VTTLPTHVTSTLGVQVAVHDLAPSLGDSHPLLVSHATGFHGRCYLPMAADLARTAPQPLHAIAFDYRGHGDTARPDGPVDWQRYGDDAEAMAAWLADRHGGPIDAFGHSMGGACLLIAAHRRPDLFRRLVVFEPIVFPPEGIGPAGRADADAGDSPLAAGARRRRAVFASHRAAIDNFAAKPPLSIFTEESLEAYVVHGFGPDPEGVRLKCSPDTEAETFAMGARHDTWDHLPSIATETLVVAGIVQPMQPSSISQAVADRLPHSRYLQLDHLTHFGPMSHPAETARIVVDFVTGGRVA